MNNNSCKHHASYLVTLQCPWCWFWCD